MWIEFKNASKWQAELLFRNFFPSTDEDNIPIEGDLDSIELPTTPPSPSAASSSGSTLFSSLSSTLTTPELEARLRRALYRWVEHIEF